MKTGIKRGWRYGIAVLWLSACGGATGTPTVGGESHFLRHCGDGCGAGLKCISDLCTRDCVVDQDGCNDLSQGAHCTNASVEPGAVAVCDVACNSDRDCRTVGSSFGCDAGFCRERPPIIPNPSGNAGSGANAGGGQQGGGGSSSTGATGSGGSSVGGQSSQPGPLPAKCSLPFNGGSCLGYFPVFAAVDGKCTAQVWGGCEGNDNRFTTIEECMSVCEGRPTLQACPADRPPQDICLECGVAGGCPKFGSYCAQTCDDTHPCDSQFLMCFQGICQQYGCE